MKKAIKAKWIKALTGGEYKQGVSRLRYRGRFCCLGVLTDLYLKECGGRWGQGGILGVDGELPTEVAGWAGLPPADGAVSVKRVVAPDGTRCLDLADMNDYGFKFSEIAAKIKAEL